MNYKAILLFFNLSLLAMNPEEIVALMTPQEAVELIQQLQQGRRPAEDELLTAYKAHAQHDENLDNATKRTDEHLKRYTKGDSYTKE